MFRNLQLIFVIRSACQKYGGDFSKFCGLLRIYELSPLIYFSLSFCLLQLGNVAKGSDRLFAYFGQFQVIISTKRMLSFSQSGATRKFPLLKMFQKFPLSKMFQKFTLFKLNNFKIKRDMSLSIFAILLFSRPFFSVL